LETQLIHSILAVVSGTLYLVSTPIGNLEDITYRAVRVLKEADLIACEDTRHTSKLLQHYGIERPTISYHEHNENDRSLDLLNRLKNGETIAVVSDAGTPLISDPGYRLVSQAAKAGVTVSAIPGPSAVLTALAASGLPTDEFHFAGFLPAKSGQRRKELERLAGLDTTVVVYEAPHRIIETLEDIGEVYGDTPVVVTRELTKVHEEFLRGTADSILLDLNARPSIKGEMTLVIGKRAPREHHEQSIAEAVAAHMQGGASRMDAMKAVARERGLSKREVYTALENAE
jgi:16S rRNA (cytidine1402-2'-O)-methyltransferase